jgi:hypothetical protein
MAFVRNGDVFVRDLRSGALTQLTRSNAAASRPQFAADGGLIWRVGNDWYHWNAATGTVQAAMPKAERTRPRRRRPTCCATSSCARWKPCAATATSAKPCANRPSPGAGRPDPRAGAAVPGRDVEIVDSALSPDCRHLLVVTKPKGFDDGRGARCRCT